MAKVTNHALIVDGVESTITLAVPPTIVFTVAGDLIDDNGDLGGMTGQAVFGSWENLWSSGTNHNKYRWFFFQGVGELGSLLEIRGGSTIDAGDIKFLRNTGLRYRSGFAADSTVTKEWAGLTISGSIDAADQPYVYRANDTSKVNLAYAGDFNEPVQIYDSAGNDDRASLILYVRTQGRTYAYYDLATERGLSTILPVEYQISATTAVDLKGSGSGCCSIGRLH